MSLNKHRQDKRAYKSVKKIYTLPGGMASYGIILKPKKSEKPKLIKAAIGESILSRDNSVPLRNTYKSGTVWIAQRAALKPKKSCASRTEKADESNSFVSTLKSEIIEANCKTRQRLKKYTIVDIRATANT